MNFLVRAAASVTAAALLLTGCGWSGNNSMIPPAARNVASSAVSLVKEAVAPCHALSSGGARCGTLTLAIPSGAEIAQNGNVVAKGSRETLYANVTTHKWLSLTSGVFHNWPRSVRHTSVLVSQVSPGDPFGCPYCRMIAGDTPGPLPAGAQMGSDGNAWDANGNEMGWCSDCGADSNGAWIYVIGSTSNNTGTGAL